MARILIVDDDIAVQATLRIVLERAGHDAMVANDGSLGLAALQSGRFDLLLLDVLMPGMDGQETMRRIHQQHPLLPIIIISGRPVALDLCSVPDRFIAATELGMVSSLQKPFKPSVLLAAVTRSLDDAARRSPSPIETGDAVSRP